ncbi:hypothetical protein EUGRSUZ_H02552 [Eucalyptus grandis]|uniref:Uncharacterized protein n=2 Tax=Eucalyptus grandis TaxID=71139 RepID=A0ACC3JSV4_EUCGR|nr:hypothetical protein EUGRSUZ_H02552 [Eucalyptus grandis]
MDTPDRKMNPVKNELIFYFVRKILGTFNFSGKKRRTKARVDRWTVSQYAVTNILMEHEHRRENTACGTFS